ncbi:uncharacterized protein LOC143852645 isoform X2 [Tasmannia lanceolata]|uniref:uncharacterized protein LOC143852645 isoform X2 n=1 Tax=Tasmannia lanceolata TaxID=3420 RepID=UPI00406438B4
MGSTGDTNDDKKEGFSISTDTQLFNIDSSPSGEDFKDGDGDETCPLQSTMQFDDTLPLEDDFLFETELVKEDTDLGGETQVLEDTDCILGEFETEVVIDSDAEGTDRTEVLRDSDGVSDDVASRCEVNDCGTERKDGNGAKCFGNTPSIPAPRSYDQDGRNVVMDSAASIDEECSSGFVHRSFTSVRSASLRSSGLAAARSITPKITKTEQNPTLSNSQAEQKQDNNRVPHSVSDGIGKDIGITSLRWETSLGMGVCEVDKDHETENSHQNTQDKCRNETRRRIKNGTARKLFAEDTPSDNEETIKKIDRTSESIDSLRLVVRDNAFAGLNYVGSQEPGELSQVNALDVVDKLLSINGLEPCGEVDPRENLGEKLPPVSSGKGPQSLAKRAHHRSPVGKEGVFDWIDSHEDERGGDFFTRRKDEFFESRDHIRKSLTQPRKPKHLNLKRTRGIVDEFEVNEEGINPQIHKKIIGLTCSDSRLMLHSSINCGKVQISKTKTKKNIFKDLDEQLTSEPSGQQLETTAIGRGFQSIYDVGIDTQLAAEAMEALVCGPPANHKFMDAHPETKDLTEGSTGGAKMNKARSKPVQKKRVSSASNSKVTTRLSKRMNKRGAALRLKDSRSKDLGQEPVQKTKSKMEKRNHKDQLNIGHSVKGSECSSEKSSKLVKARKTKVALNETYIKVVDICRNPLSPNGHELVQEQHLPWTVTPVAHRTRQSSLRKPLKSTDKNSVVGAPDTLKVEGKCFIPDPSQNRKPEKINTVQSKVWNSEPLYKGKHKTSCPTTDALTDPRQRRTRRSMSDDLDNASNLNDPSMINNGVLEAKTQSSIRRKRSRIDGFASDPHVPSETNTRTSGHKKVLVEFSVRTRSSSRNSHPFVLPAEKNSKETMASERLFGNCSVGAAIDSSIASMSEKMSPNDLTVPTSGTFTISGRGDGASSSILPVEDAEENVTVEGSLKEKIQPSGSACTTPISKISAVSPICMGDDPRKQSGETGLSKSSLKRELIRLDVPNASLTPPLKDIRRRRDMASVRVLFSHHLGEDIIKPQKKILARLGVSIASTSTEATHFIADKFVRTRNMLEAMALGKPVVTHLWLESCGQASCFVDEKNYILRDLKKEKEIGFNMVFTLARACQSPLLQGKRVFITPNIKPNRELVASLVRAVQGQAIERIGRSILKDDKIPDDLLVISCEEDYTICVPLLEKGAEIYSSELLLNGIVIQKLEYKRWHRHRLFLDHVKRTRSTIWLRNEDGNQFHPVAKRT